MRRQQSCYGIATGAAQDPACLSSGLPVPWQCNRSAGKGRVGMQLSSACASRAVIGETHSKKKHAETFPDYLLRTHSGKHLHTSLSGWLIRAGAKQTLGEGTPTIPASAWGEDILLFVRHLSFQRCCPQLPLPSEARQWQTKARISALYSRGQAKGWFVRRPELPAGLIAGLAHAEEPLQESAGQRPPQLPSRGKQAPARRNGRTPVSPSRQAARGPLRLPPGEEYPVAIWSGDRDRKGPAGCPRERCGPARAELLTAAPRGAPAPGNSTRPLAARSVRIQMYPGARYQGYFLKRTFTSNVCNWCMNIHDLWGGFHNYFILLRLIWSAAATAVVYTPSSGRQQFGSMTFPVSCAGEQLELF